MIILEFHENAKFSIMKKNTWKFGYSILTFQLIVLDIMQKSKNKLHIMYFQDQSIGIVNIESCKEQASLNKTVAIRHATNYYDLDIAQVNTTNTFFELKNHIT